MDGYGGRASNITRLAHEELRHAPRAYVNDITDAIVNLADNPYPQGSRLISMNMFILHSLEVGKDWHLYYSIETGAEDQSVIIHRVFYNKEYRVH